LATVGVGPGSAVGSISAGRNDRSAGRWGPKRVGWDVQSGVSVLRNVGRSACGRRPASGEGGTGNGLTVAVRYETDALSEACLTWNCSMGLQLIRFNYVI
jgi:hypothetical protein